MWGAIIGGVFAATIAGALYLVWAFGKFGLVQKLAAGSRVRRLVIPAAFIGAVFGLLVLTLNTVNAVMVLLHVVLFTLLFGLIFRIVKAVRGKPAAHFWQGWLAVGCSAVYLVIAYIICHTVVRTDYTVRTQKLSEPLKIALIADSHIGTTFDGEGFAEHLRTIEEQHPDMLLIAGDFVDDGTGKEDMVTACKALGEMDLKYGVWYVSGNHDGGYFNRRNFSYYDLEKELTQNGVGVLDDEVVTPGEGICIIGRQDKNNRSRMPIASLMEKADKSDYIIVMDHQPNDYAAEAEAGADLVVSGHTHGGQLLPATYVGEWIGANDRTYGYERRGNTDFIVTSGIADWEIKFKSGTKSEYVIIEVQPES